MRFHRPLGHGTVDAHWPCDVFEALLPDIGKLGLDFASHLPERILGDADAAGLGDGFEACGDVDAVAVDVPILDNHIAQLDNHVAQIDTDAVLDASVCRDIGIALADAAVHRQRAGDRLDDARELDQ